MNGTSGGKFTRLFLDQPVQWSPAEFAGIGFALVAASVYWAYFINHIA